LKIEKEEKEEITVLTPYTKQVSALNSQDVQVFTIDSFQGRECDVIISSTVRCNIKRDIRFVEDERK